MPADPCPPDDRPKRPDLELVVDLDRRLASFTDRQRRASMALAHLILRERIDHVAASDDQLRVLCDGLDHAATVRDQELARVAESELPIEHRFEIAALDEIEGRRAAVEAAYRSLELELVRALPRSSEAVEPVNRAASDALPAHRDAEFSLRIPRACRKSARARRLAIAPAHFRSSTVTSPLP